MFVTKEPVAVADGENTIWIRPKMDYGTRSRVVGALLNVSERKGQHDLRLDLGEYNLALLTANVVKWSGPDFAGVACTVENIMRLDPDDPLVDKVVAEIARRNPLTRAEDPKAGQIGAGESTTAGAQL